MIYDIAAALDTDKLVFEAADPVVFEWYIRTFGPTVNLFIDNSQITQLEFLRTGLFGQRLSFARVVSHRKDSGPTTT